jgi:hypothetical protein
MNLLLAFAPFLLFAVVDRLVGPTQGLIAGALAALVLLVRDWLTPGKTPKVLEIGTTLLFGGLALYALLGGASDSLLGVRLRVDAGLLVVVLVSMVIRQPFTMQYAREQVPREYWNSPEFVRTNYVITAVWALAFAIMVLADFAMLYTPNFSPRAGIIVTVLALVGAVKFTGWYPERGKTNNAQ